MNASPKAGKPADPSILIDVSKLLTADHAGRPDSSVPAQRVVFGTSGHRGCSIQLLQRGTYTRDYPGDLPLPKAARHRRTVIRRCRYTRALGARLQKRIGGAGRSTPIPVPWMIRMRGSPARNARSRNFSTSSRASSAVLPITLISLDATSGSATETLIPPAAALPQSASACAPTRPPRRSHRAPRASSSAPRQPRRSCRRSAAAPSPFCPALAAAPCRPRRHGAQYAAAHSDRRDRPRVLRNHRRVEAL